MAEPAILHDATSGDRETITKELADIERASARLTRAIASSDSDLTSLVEAMKRQRDWKALLETKLASLAESRVPAGKLDAKEARASLSGYQPDWNKLLGGHREQAQQVLGRLIVGRLTVKPAAGGHYAFSAKGTVVPLLARSVQNWRPHPL